MPRLLTRTKTKLRADQTFPLVFESDKGILIHSLLSMHILNQALSKFLGNTRSVCPLCWVAEDMTTRISREQPETVLSGLSKWPRARTSQEMMVLGGFITRYAILFSFFNSRNPQYLST